MKLSIIIPVFNEEKTIEEILKKVSQAKILNWEREIIIVDDGSTDNSKVKISTFASTFVQATADKELAIDKQNPIKVVFHEKNQGKGAAIRTALKEVTGDYVLIQDADLEYDPNDYQVILRPIEEGKSEIVYGSRNLKLGKRGYFLNFWGGKFLAFLINLFFGSSLTDINTGYKVFKTEILKSFNLKSSKFEFCEEVTIKALKKGYKILEVPISYNPRKIEEGKKLRLIDGLIGLWTIIKLKFFG